MAEPYWSQINWTVIIGLMGGVATISSPFMVGWWNNRVKGLETEAQTAERVADRLERRANEQYERILARAEFAEKRAETLESEVTELRAQSRSMDDWAHYYRHGWSNLILRFRALVSMFEALVDGTMAPERAKAILAELKPTLSDAPPAVPMLRDAATAGAPPAT